MKNKNNGSKRHRKKMKEIKLSNSKSSSLNLNQQQRIFLSKNIFLQIEPKKVNYENKNSKENKDKK